MFNVLTGKALTKLKEFPDNYFDSCVLDGPYGIGFMGNDWDDFKSDEDDNTSLSSNKKFQRWFELLAVEIYRVLKPGAFFVSFGGTRTHHRMICGIEDAGFEIRDCLGWLFGSGFPKSKNLPGGFGSALKPAWEPICLARKPIEGNLEQNFKKWGTGVLNIDACRIQGEPWTFGAQTDFRGGNYNTNRPSDGHVFRKNVVGGKDGRWPANVMHDGSDEVLSGFPYSKSGMMRGGTPRKESVEQNKNCYGTFSGNATDQDTYGDDGSAARFFYCAKASRADRNEGLEHLEKKPLFWSSGTKNPGSFQSDGTDKYSQNNHPTVKPTKLMRYINVLVTPPGGHILDPCSGSGTTGKAAILDGFSYTGIEQEKQWVEIQISRLQHAERVRKKLLSVGKQLSL